MNFDYIETADEDVCHFRIKENITYLRACEIVKEQHRTQKTTDITKFLIDVRDVISETTATDDFNLAHKFARNIGLSEDTKTALLVRPEDYSHHFVEIVGRKAGHNIAIFNDKNLAEIWLAG